MSKLEDTAYNYGAKIKGGAMSDMSTDTTTPATDRELVQIEAKARATTVMHWPELVRTINRLRQAEAERDRLRAALDSIVQWSESYPLNIFQEPDLNEAYRLLVSGGITLDAVAASVSRHVVKGVGEIARAALAKEAGQ